MTSKIVVNNIEADAGVSTVTFNSNVERGSSNLHSTGLNVNNTFVHSTGIALGAGSTIGAVTGVTTYYGDGSNLTGIDATKIITGNTQVQTIDTGSDGHVKVTTEGSERLRITSAGKLGVGVASPVSILHLHEAGSDGAPIIQFSNGDTGVTTGDGFAIGMADNESPFIFNRENTDLRIATNNTERFRIGSSGQFGIGGATYGTSGQVLTSGGASAAPTWGGAGKVLQMTYKRGGVTSSSNSGGWTDSVESGLNVDITPLSATSRIIIQMHSVGGNTSSGRSYFLRLRRKVNNTGDTNVASFQIGDGSNGGMQSLALTHVDYDASSPFNTSHVRNYRIRFGQDGSGTARFDYATTSVLYCLEIQ